VLQTEASAQPRWPGHGPAEAYEQAPAEQVPIVRFAIESQVGVPHIVPDGYTQLPALSQAVAPQDWSLLQLRPQQRVRQLFEKQSEFCPQGAPAGSATGPESCGPASFTVALLLLQPAIQTAARAAAQM
jgi:hypothetical protein